MKNFLVLAALLSVSTLCLAVQLPKLQTSNFRYVVHKDSKMMPTPLPDGVSLEKGNNCVGILYFAGRLYVGWRSAPSHFASPRTKIYIISSANNGTLSWDLENVIEIGSDMREPYFFVIKSELYFTFFQAGTTWYEF